jgi:hypothetical protein
VEVSIDGSDMGLMVVRVVVALVAVAAVVLRQLRGRVSGPYNVPIPK